MRAAILLSVLAIIPTFVTSTPESGTEPSISNIVVDIYYEALCPDSQKFFNEQFQPNIGLILEGKIDVVLTPYGKEKHVLDETGAWQSECRHSETECLGHKVQACAIKNLSPYPSTVYHYIVCLMKRGQKNKPYPGKECADHVKKEFPHIDYSAIDLCATTPEADQEIEVLRERTEALQPPLASVPTIVFNNVYNKEDQHLSLKNFKKVLCQYLSANSQDLKTCTSSSSAGGPTMSCLTLLLSGVAAFLIAQF